MRRALALSVAVLALAACAGGPPQPVAIDTRNDACAWCRMNISDPRFAAQLLAPAEEPLVFDDVGCLAHYLAAHPPKSARAIAYVADHKTKAWVIAAAAVYGQGAEHATPMNSGFMAWADEASRSADPDAASVAARTPQDVFPPAGPPDGRP